MMFLSSRLVVLFGTIAVLSCMSELVEGDGFPKRFRAEGKLTFTYASGTHGMTFTETIDSYKSKSTVSIGSIGYKPNKYYKFKDGKAISVIDGKCSGCQSRDFIDEIRPFFEVNLQNITSNLEHFVGPSKIILVLDEAIKKFGHKERLSKETHRNLNCEVKTRIFDYQNIHFEYITYKPENLYNSIPYFSVALTTNRNIADEIPNGLILDYFHIDSTDDDDARFDRNMRSDFNLPLGVGCSEFFKSVTPNVETQSMTMKYTQASISADIILAYDHSANLLRKDYQNKGFVNIWDLKDDIVYHMRDASIISELLPGSDIKGKIQSCSLLRVNDNNLSPVYRPFQLEGESLDVLSMIGATNIVYMGRSAVRGLPCLIFETTLKEAPVLFSTGGESMRSNVDKYIVQFHVTYSKQDDEEPEEKNHFWPAKIVLFKQVNNTITKLDQLDIYDFYWGLDGLSLKSSELFMASDCFYDEAEQVRLQFSAIFDEAQVKSVSFIDKPILALNRIKLEYDLIDIIFKKFGISKTHLIDYDVNLKLYEVDLKMSIGDRIEEKELLYWPDGRIKLAKEEEKDHLITLKIADEGNCVSLASLVDQITLVSFCPQSNSRDPACIIVYNKRMEDVPTFVSDDPDQPNCFIFKFKTYDAHKGATSVVREGKDRFKKYSIEFPARKPEANNEIVNLEGHMLLQDMFTEIQLIQIDDYTYDLTNTDGLGDNLNVKHFDMTYTNEYDCANMCNLDASCKSYSFCEKKVDDSPSCILSKLDLRIGKVVKQLTQPTKVGDLLLVQGADSNGYYLKFSEFCNIHERNYLNMFRQTGEIIALNQDIKDEEPYIKTVATTSECAELSADSHDISMFAYFPMIDICIIGEPKIKSLLEEVKISQNAELQDVVGHIYRKRYQALFKVSTNVIKQESDQNNKHTYLHIEDCASACWHLFDRVCASFDYCSSDHRCIINEVTELSPGVKLELRPSCLHYEPDSDIKRVFNISIHQNSTSVLKPQNSSKFWLYNVITLLLASGAFIYGLVLGRQVSDKIRSVRSRGQSVGGAISDYARRKLGYRIFHNNNSQDDELGIDNPNVIRLDDIEGVER